MFSPKTVIPPLSTYCMNWLKSVFNLTWFLPQTMIPHLPISFISGLQPTNTCLPQKVEITLVTTGWHVMTPSLLHFTSMASIWQHILVNHWPDGDKVKFFLRKLQVTFSSIKYLSHLPPLGRLQLVVLEQIFKMHDAPYVHLLCNASGTGWYFWKATFDSSLM